MHNAGGLKYIGCENVDAYRKALYKHNAKASGKAVDENKFVKIADEIMEKLGGRFNDKAEYKASKKALNKIMYDEELRNRLIALHEEESPEEEQNSEDNIQ